MGIFNYYFFEGNCLDVKYFVCGVL
uniref:Uncharacterized protein n=1 Tax=Medicago truncatula TaxID=3880 RepID=I3T8Q6_MEDTR|nr:unknown [Medicago truncatula]